MNITTPSRPENLRPSKTIVPIRPQTFSEFQTLLEKINNRADIVEVWLDQVKENFWEEFASYEKKMRFLGVCKSPDEHGNFLGTPEERIKILQKFLDAGGNFVDVDVQRNERELIRTLPSKNLILSFHDFDGIPKNLDNIFARMYFFSPQIYKFAVTTNTPMELVNFLQFVKTFPSEHDAIFTTMGTLGREGRDQIEQLGRNWGAFFALDEESKTAKGQKTLDELS